ncbi:hypothetical protein Csa_020484 [Cucumis sativus]|nr:hypothetical protein Csa_020484 [Cucumis sativus]
MRGWSCCDPNTINDVHYCGVIYNDTSNSEMQLTLVVIRDFKIEIPIDRSMCIPSVFGRSSGAIMLTPWNVRFFHPRMLTWKFLLSNDVILLTIELVMKSNLKL